MPSHTTDRAMRRKYEILHLSDGLAMFVLCVFVLLSFVRAYVLCLFVRFIRTIDGMSVTIRSFLL